MFIQLQKKSVLVMLSSDASRYSSPQKRTIEYDVEVEVSSNASEQKKTSDDDEPEDAYADGPLAEENWLGQYKAESQKEQELDGLVSVAISTGVEEQARSVLPQVRLASIERCVHKFPDFQKCFSSSGNKRKRICF